MAALSPIILNSLFYSTLPGLGGGVVIFLYAYSHNNYRNNKYVAKLFIELIGSAVTATFLTTMLSNPIHQVLVSFCIGIGWTKIIQTIRSKITKFVELILGE